MPTPTSQPAEVLGADTWHTAGIKGTGTEVGIIDSDFRNLDTKVKNQIIQGSQFFCYDSNGTPTFRHQVERNAKVIRDHINKEINKGINRDTRH